MTSRSIASPLADRVYRHLYLAQISALTGTGVMTVGLALLAYQLAGEDAGAVLGIALSLRIVAFVLISPVFGAYAHLLPRRRVLVALDVLRAATVLLLPFVDAVWQVYALIFVINACSAGFTPLFQATIPDVLPDEARYTRALSLSRLAYDLQQLLAPALAGVLLWFLPLGRAVRGQRPGLPDLRGAACSPWCCRAPDGDAARGRLANIGWGIRLYLATPRLRGLLALSMAVAAATAMVIVNTVVYVQGVLGGGDTLVTLAYAASGAGSMLVALLLPKLLDRVAERTAMLAGGAVMAVWHACRDDHAGARRTARDLVPDRGRLVAGADARRPAAASLVPRGGSAGPVRGAVRALARLLAPHLSGRRRGRHCDRPPLDLRPPRPAGGARGRARGCGYGRLPIPSCSSTSTLPCGTSICTPMTSITSTSTRAGRARSRTVIRTGTGRSAIAIAS